MMVAHQMQVSKVRFLGSHCQAEIAVVASKRQRQRLHITEATTPY